MVKLQKVRSLSPCSPANWCVFFFGALASSVLSSLSGYVDISLIFAVFLGLICTFCFKVCFLNGKRAAWSHGVYTSVIFFKTDECGTFRYLEIPPKDEPDLWMSTSLFVFLRFFLSSFDFHMMPKSKPQ